MDHAHPCGKAVPRAALALIGLLPFAAGATELVYRPLNPSFGGNPLLSSHYLALASAQKETRNDRSGFTPQTAGQQFVNQLQSRLLSSLASQVNDALFGDHPQDSGTIVFGDQTINFNRGLEFITINVLNTSTGEQTEIKVPVLQVTTAGTTTTPTGP